MARRIIATEKQKRAVNNILSGQFKSMAEAMREAGYAKTTSHRPAEKLFKSKGIEAYINSLSISAQKRWNLSLPDKVALAYLDGLEATKLVGKNAIKCPDFDTRLQYADRFATFLGWNNDSN